MQVDNLLIVKQSLRTFLDMIVNIKVVNMLNVKLKYGHFNKKFWHLCKNLHIQLQCPDVPPKALAGFNNVACKVKNG
jgi:hypothetical protein